MRTYVSLKFADGEYCFKLPLPRIRELQEKTGAGLGALYARVLQGRVPDEIEQSHPAYGAYHIDDLRETVRQSLIGGASGRVDGEDVTVSAIRANELVTGYLDTMPVKEQWDLAAAILYALIEGYSDEETDAEDAKADAADKKKVTPTAKGGSTTQAQ